MGLFAGLPRRYDELGAIMSFGQDPRWRRAVVESVKAKQDDRVLDVATGTGLIAAGLVKRYGCAVVGLDQSDAMLARARARARVNGSSALRDRIELVRGDADRLPFAAAEFDALTFTYLLRYVDDPGRTMRELARVVRPGGMIAMLEFGVPTAVGLRQLWWLHTRVGLPVLGALGGGRAWYEVGRFLGPSISSFHARRTPEDLVAMWERAGIAAVEFRRMSFGAGIVMRGVRGHDD